MLQALPISPSLQKVLDSIPDRALADRLGLVYVAAANAIERLGDMDLVNYESTTIDAAPDLSLWEEMAPLIRDTVVDVNALLSVVREQFPSTGRRAGSSSAAAEAESALRAVTEQLGQQVTQLGMRMRSPEVVSDRWNLLADLQSFRSRFREMIGDLVYLSATSFGEVHRVDVVPGYREEVQAAVQLRAVVADLSRLMQARNAEIDKAESEDVQWYAQHLERDLDAFGKTGAYRALRAQDKRATIEFRHALNALAARSDATKNDLVSVLQPFVQFVGSLQRVNQREVLVAQDREVWAACGVKLEQAQLAIGRDEATARRLLLEAAKLAMGLYGRDAGLDVFLRKARKGQLESASRAALALEVEALRELLANLPMV
ncbi:MAG: hypothetical protein WBV82_03715 [Myxococcaceae bacterium]